jgi:hypothetical protein
MMYIVREQNGGAIVTETGTRNIAITQGSWWIGLSKYTTAAFDSSAAGTFTYFYNSAAYVAVASQTQIDNTQYDNAGTLTALGNNQYGVHWVYIGVDSDVYIIYGTASYTLSDATDIATPPSITPPHFEKHAALLGKIIIQKNASTFSLIQSAFATAFTAGASNTNVVNGLGTDEAVCRFDTNGNTIQNTGVLIDDTDNITGAKSLTVEDTNANIPKVLIKSTDGTAGVSKGQVNFLNSSDGLEGQLFLTNWSSSAEMYLMSLGGAEPTLHLVAGTSQITLTNTSRQFRPIVDNQIDLGGVSNQFKDAYLSGQLNANTIVADDIDSKTATTLLLGKATATKVELADTGVNTEVQGALTVNETSNLIGATTFGTGGTSYVFPTTRGTLDQVLKTDANGVVTWQADSGALTLQEAYNNSGTPEITTDATRVALTLRRGSTADTDKVLEIMSGGNQVNASIDGNGLLEATTAVLTSDTTPQLSINRASVGGTTSRISFKDHLDAVEANLNANSTRLVINSVGKVRVSSETEVYPYNTGAGQAGTIGLFELAANGTNAVKIRAPDSITSTYTLTLPAPAPAVDQVLRSDASGNLSWVLYNQPSELPMALVRAVATQSVTTGTQWGVEYDTNVKLVDMTHPTASPPTNQRITAPTAGHYQISYEIWWTSTTSADARSSYIAVNGNIASTDLLYGRIETFNKGGSSTPCGVSGSALVPLSANDYFEIYVTQASGVNLTLGEAQNSRRCEVSAFYVAPL